MKWKMMWTEPVAIVSKWVRAAKNTAARVTQSEAIADNELAFS